MAGGGVFDEDERWTWAIHWLLLPPLTGFIGWYVVTKLFPNILSHGVEDAVVHTVLHFVVFITLVLTSLAIRLCIQQGHRVLLLGSFIAVACLVG